MLKLPLPALRPAVLPVLLLALLAACVGGRGAPTDLHRAADGSLLPLPVPLVIAHRGYSGIAPENTEVAVALGADVPSEYVEIDVQMSADGGIVVMHDTTLTRTTDAPLQYPLRAPWNVADFTLEEMRALDAGTWYGRDKEPGNFAYAGEPVPDLRTILDTLRDRAGLLLEVKSPGLYPGIEAAIAAELEAAGWVEAGAPTQPLIVQSFDWESMARYAQLHPQVPVGLLGNPPTDEAIWTAVAEYADWMNPSHSRLDAELVAEIHRRGLRTSPYTVNDAARMRELLDMGVDGIITDQPTRLRQVRDAALAPQGEFALQNGELNELSGLARSLAHPGVYWGHNDSGDRPRLFAFAGDGRDLGTLELSGAGAVDWEDMASFVEDGQPKLLLADVGDNEALRPFVTLYIVAEPATAPPYSGMLPVERTLTLTYPDGPRDCEGVAVDAQAGAIYLLSKRDPRPRLYRIPLDAPEGLPLTAEFLGEVDSLPLPEGGELAAPGEITNVSPTALALNRSHALIVTLEHSYRYPRAPGQSLLEALAGTPQRIVVPEYRQIESGDFIAEGAALLIGSEGRPAAMYASAEGQ